MAQPRDTERRSRDEPYAGPEKRGNRREEIEAWWFLIARMLAFALGFVILTITLLVAEVEGGQFYITLTIAVGLMWPIIGPGVTQAFAILRGQNGRRNGG